MFDTKIGLTFNSPASGIIQKSTEKSFFVRMHQNSQMSKEVFTDVGEYNKKPVVVLQTLLSHEGWFLTEMIYKKDLE